MSLKEQQAELRSLKIELAAAQAKLAQLQNVAFHSENVEDQIADTLDLIQNLEFDIEDAEDAIERHHEDEKLLDYEG